MSGETNVENVPNRWQSRRALSTITAVLVMVIVVVVAGAAAYIALGSKSATTCWPPGSPGCSSLSSTHNLQVLAPFKSTQTGNTIPFTILLPSGSTASQYSFNFGDGSSPAWVTSSTPTSSHAFTYPGTYIIQVQATFGGSLHDNQHALVIVTIAASFTATSAGNSPSVAGAVVSNTTATSGATAILKQGQAVTLLGSYLGAPTNPNFAPISPTISISPAVTVTPTTTATSIRVAPTFTSSGTYVVTMVAEADGNGPFAGQKAIQNYVWTVVVTPNGQNGGTAGSAAAKDPHPGTFIYYSSAQGGASSLDPAIAYDTVSYEPILSVYEGLIMYNGSKTGPDPSVYLPVLATCVPGPSSQTCNSLYGSSLYNAATSSYTFPIDKNARFYDPNGAGTKAWAVWPSDVMFSLARTLGFSDLPGAGSHNGWIIAQSLLPGAGSSSMAANSTWDGGMHYPYNNTPQAVFSSMSVNDSTCTAAIMAASNGCVTFHATGGGLNWPYFLELAADQLGASIVSCGWVSGDATNAGQAGIPYWTKGNVSGEGDHPCLLPSGAKASSDSGVTAWLAATPAKGWDQWEQDGSGNDNGGGSVGNPISAMVGTGPFYLSSYSAGTFYSLQASPAYAPNPTCTWLGCMPAKGHTPQKVEVTWESDISQGEQAIAAGVADTAAIPATDTALLLQLIQQGKVNALSFPSISIYFWPYNLAFNLAGAQKYTTNPITVPTDWFTYVGMRQFFTTAYPYTTVAQTVLTVDGIQGGFNYGGAIPQFMANYYPTNISWPNQDPSQACAGSGATSPLCATWWWTQLTTPSSPYYDSEAAKCSTSSPCQLPLIGETGAPPLDVAQNLWVNSINSLSGGKLKVTYTDINFGTLVANSLFATPYQGSMPFYTLGWAPDYPDPTDYVVPLYYPDSTYTYSDTVAEQFAALNGSSCSQSFQYYVALTSPVSEACQGAAYNLMINAMNIAAVLPAGPQRVLLYNQAEHIANQLALYTYQYQANQIFTLSTWVDVSSVITNVTTGGGGDFTFWGLSGNGVWG
jgi:peptide/nickel transport system substrate-binding protein